jgi:hypothetical protein
MEEIYRSYKNQVEFFVVYVQEAHPTDGWQSESNITESVLFRQHQNYEEREGVAQTCSLSLHIDIPILIEEIDNSIDEAYGAAPERLYLIGANGKVAYQGGAGPHFFNLDEWQNAIEACLNAKV